MRAACVIAVLALSSCAGSSTIHRAVERGRDMRAGLEAAALRPLSPMSGSGVCPGVVAYDYAQVRRAIAQVTDSMCDELAGAEPALREYIISRLPGVEPQNDPTCFPRQAVVSERAMVGVLGGLDRILEALEAAAEVPRLSFRVESEPPRARVEFRVLSTDPTPKQRATTDEVVVVRRGLYHLSMVKSGFKPAMREDLDLVDLARVNAVRCVLVPADAAGESTCVVYGVGSVVDE